MILICDKPNERIDKYVTADGLTRSQIQKLIENGDITVNGRCVKPNYKLKLNDEINITLPEPKEADIKAENIPLDIVYEDNDLLVVNKPRGMVVHPAPGNYEGTLVNALMYHCKDSLSGINGVLRPGIVHRIDKDTSGLLLVAKTNEAHLSLADQLKEKTTKREYVCIVNGLLKSKSGTIDAPIGRHPTSRLKMTVTASNSKNAVTHFKVLEYLNNATYVSCRLETGRTHQIRVHFKSLGAPLVGDDMYGSTDKRLSHQALHCCFVRFTHPVTEKIMEFTAPMPDDMNKLT